MSQLIAHVQSPSTSTVWPEGSQAIQRAGTAIAKLARIPLLPTPRIACAVAAVLSEFPLQSSVVAVVIGVEVEEDAWRPVVAGSSRYASKTGVQTHDIEHAESERLRLPSDAKAVPVAGCRLGMSLVDFVVGYSTEESVAGVARAVHMSLRARSTNSVGHVLEVTWSTPPGIVPSETHTHLECLLQHALDTIDGAFPEGVGHTQKLTATELRITRLLLEGHKIPEVAARIKTSKHTIHDHAKSLHRKLNVCSREEMFFRAMRPATDTLA